MNPAALVPPGVVLLLALATSVSADPERPHSAVIPAKPEAKMADGSTVALPLVAALWAASGMLLSFTKELNAIRDKVSTGFDGARAIPVAHRSVLLANDWKPLSCVFVLLTWAFAGIVFLLASMYPAGMLTVACCIIGLFFIACGALWWCYGKKEYRQMKALIRQAESTPDSGTVGPSAGQPSNTAALSLATAPPR